MHKPPLPVERLNTLFLLSNNIGFPSELKPRRRQLHSFLQTSQRCHAHYTPLHICWPLTEGIIRYSPFTNSNININKQCSAQKTQTCQDCSSIGNSLVGLESTQTKSSNCVKSKVWFQKGAPEFQDTCHNCYW